MVSYSNELSDNGNKFKIVFMDVIKGCKIRVNKHNTKSLHVSVSKPDKVFKNEASVVRYFKSTLKSNNLKIEVYALKA